MAAPLGSVTAPVSVARYSCAKQVPATITVKQTKLLKANRTTIFVPLVLTLTCGRPGVHSRPEHNRISDIHSPRIHLGCNPGTEVIPYSQCKLFRRRKEREFAGYSLGKHFVCRRLQTSNAWLALLLSMPVGNWFSVWRPVRFFTARLGCASCCCT